MPSKKGKIYEDHKFLNQSSASPQIAKASCQLFFNASGKSANVFGAPTRGSDGSWAKEKGMAIINKR
ncbi:MAG: hypothetical protein COU42_00100 [Candidatus Nealsonbacteria bacterium CG10_big_fil_rev_8_21_14_0_10_36_24]|uniref:Uncharacterized protein n=2 Tax=Candidatus Nealsoniibacteriota TaxID=1817911 RepID=A0A2H0YP50_9BACT|nr:MAG: hypothetical protein COU42_00100 [Candidatus Nealsonbacteria bacterium CG10_big_fil_rev_8_21_14_0_10_36_24]PIS40240.1 MAG: hypothetical protein COT32_00855 [Candidatus Nealsonbacteria bacterium CG08_land_8_20_14_0_20_36_22]